MATNVHGLDDKASELRRILCDPRDVCRRLALDERARRHGRGILICCPWHADRTPSCSVFLGEDGTIGVKCFGCDAAGDVFHLVAAAGNLDLRRDFLQVLRRAADLAGIAPHQHSPAARRSAPPDPAARPACPPRWPPATEVASLWRAGLPVGDSPEVSAWLASRALEPGDLELFDLARAVPGDAALPNWARCNGQSWAEAGYLCILPMYDHRGRLRGLRARNVRNQEPKGVTPAGYNVPGLVMADALARSILSTGHAPTAWPAGVPLRLVVAEGEPDFLTWALAFSDRDFTAPGVIGVVNGCWTASIAERIPDGARVILRTHHDEAGERYARAIYDSLGGRCTVLRGGASNCELCPSFGWSRGVR